MTITDPYTYENVNERDQIKITAVRTKWCRYFYCITYPTARVVNTEGRAYYDAPQ